MDKEALRELAEKATPWGLDISRQLEMEDEAGFAAVGTLHDDGEFAEVLVIDTANYYAPDEAKKIADFIAAANPQTILSLLAEIQSLTEERTAWRTTAENAGAELKAIKEAEPVAWNSPDDTESVPKLVWLREKESVFLGYHFDQPFREYRDADGFYTGQQDAESYWARYEDGEPCDPDGWCQLNPPLYTLQGESK